jgi:hypothetical protein
MARSGEQLISCPLGWTRSGFFGGSVYDLALVFGETDGKHGPGLIRRQLWASGFWHKLTYYENSSCVKLSISVLRKSMANILSTEKQTVIVGALAEGNSIRSIERMTGVHRDTIMRLGVRVGQGCAKVMDEKMRDLSCGRIEVDEIWGFIGKKQKRASA